MGASGERRASQKRSPFARPRPVAAATLTRCRHVLVWGERLYRVQRARSRARAQVLDRRDWARLSAPAECWAWKRGAGNGVLAAAPPRTGGCHRHWRRTNRRPLRPAETDRERVASCGVTSPSRSAVASRPVSASALALPIRTPFPSSANRSVAT